MGTPNPGSDKAKVPFEKLVCRIDTCSVGVQHIQQCLAEMRIEAADRETKLLREVQFLTKRVKELEGEICDLKAAIPSCPPSHTKQGRAGKQRSTVAPSTRTTSNRGPSSQPVPACTEPPSTTVDDNAMAEENRPKVYVLRTGAYASAGITGSDETMDLTPLVTTSTQALGATEMTMIVATTTWMMRCPNYRKRSARRRM